MDGSHSQTEQPPGADTPFSRHKAYEKLAAEAIDKHRFWDMLWYELARDYHAAIVNVLVFARRMDSEFAGGTENRSRH